ncbi:DUF333 domain-containing protein [Providencia vermicola]|nr:DUF333 domain-containing protein [Providencia vermicola]
MLLGHSFSLYPPVAVLVENKTDQADTVAANYAQQIVNLGPGVQEACVSAGGLPALTLELNGTQTAVCQFANGKRCAADIIQSGACI